MNINDEIKKIEIDLRNLKNRLARVRAGTDLPIHHATHESGGSDSIKLDNLAEPDDNADLDSSVTKHGLMKKLDNDPTHFLNGQGNWVAGGGGDINSGCLFGIRRTNHYYVNSEAVPHMLQYDWKNPDELRAFPFLCPTSQNFDRIAVYVGGAMGAGEWVRLGIYEDSGSCSPGDLVVDSGAIQRLAGNGPVEANINETIGPGLYWLAFLTNCNQQWLTVQVQYSLPILGRDSCKQTQDDTLWWVAHAYGALPDPFPGGAADYDADPIAIYLRKS